MKNPVFLFKEFLKIVGVLAIAVPAVVLFAAWQEPSVSPTGGNVDVPLNVGATGQGKSGGLILNTGGAANGLIVDKGNVGIGTAAPDAPLQIMASNSPNQIGLHVTSPDADGAAILLTGGGAGARDYWIFSSGSTNAIGAGKLSLGVDGSTAIAIDSSGNLGIGTASPGYKLDVQAGQINSSGGLCIAGDCKTAWSQVGGGGVSQITAGTNITITPTGVTGNVTINSSGGGGGGVPSGAISFFNLSSCPSGWSAVPSAVGRYLVGGGTLTLTVGTPLGNGENRPTGYHFHFVSSSETGDGGGSGSFVANNPGSSGGRTSSAPYDNSGPFFLTAGTNAPYIQFLVCQKG